VAFLWRMLIVGALVVLAVLLWGVRDALLLAFAGVVVAVLLLAMARPLAARFGLIEQCAASGMSCSIRSVRCLHG
jgi:hypothetical protein